MYAWVTSLIRFRKLGALQNLWRSCEKNKNMLLIREQIEVDNRSKFILRYLTLASYILLVNKPNKLRSVLNNLWCVELHDSWRNRVDARWSREKKTWFLEGRKLRFLRASASDDVAALELAMSSSLGFLPIE